jgi:clan AA aspartic protease (TIGR02281 family)
MSANIEEKMITTIKVGVLTGLLLTAVSAQSTTVELVQEHGTYLVPVEINGAVRLPFRLDTGASSIVIPDDVFQTLKRSGNVNDIEYIGPVASILADGSRVASTLYVLREVRVGNFVARNVAATVTTGKGGDLLLGQSFLSQLPPWTIDYKQHALVINDTPVQQAALQPPAVTSMYDRGLGERFVFEQWVEGPPGPYVAGKKYWRHSNPRPVGCKSEDSLFTAGCESERKRERSFDDPEYKRGWQDGAKFVPVQQTALTPPKQAEGYICRHCDDPAWAERQKQFDKPVQQATKTPPRAAPSMYDKGVADRAAWEKWFQEQSGSYRAGAEYWAGERSNPRPGNCSPPVSDQLFTMGCEAAKIRLTPSDVLRKSDAEFKRGWQVYEGQPGDGARTSGP